MSSENPSNNNNLGSGPRTPATVDSTRRASQTYTRDPRYYYPEGNVVFLVEKTLFKLHSSLILPHNPTPFTPKNSTERYPKGAANMPRQLSDSCDANPIVLPTITANQFRSYLFALLGRPFDIGYHSLLVDAYSPFKHERVLLVRYLDIACISDQFGMLELKRWGTAQLKSVLASTTRLATEKWDKNTLLRLNSYARSTKDSELQSLVTNFLQYFISISAEEQIKKVETGLGPLHLDTCVDLYKHPGLSNDDPALFGCAFARILSLGHRSPTWNSRLTPLDRMILCAAQVQLISLSEEMSSVDWLHAPLPTNPLPLNIDACERCKSHFSVLWQGNFGQCEGLKSVEPLKDILALARLPQYRQHLLTDWKAAHTSFRGFGTTAFGTATSFKACWVSGLDIIDTHIQNVYKELTLKHQVYSSPLNSLP